MYRIKLPRSTCSGGPLLRPEWSVSVLPQKPIGEAETKQPMERSHNSMAALDSFHEAPQPSPCRRLPKQNAESFHPSSPELSKAKENLGVAIAAHLNPKHFCNVLPAFAKGPMTFTRNERRKRTADASITHIVKLSFDYLIV